MPQCSCLLRWYLAWHSSPIYSESRHSRDCKRPYLQREHWYLACPQHFLTVKSIGTHVLSGRTPYINLVKSANCSQGLKGSSLGKVWITTVLIHRYDTRLIHKLKPPQSTRRMGVFKQLKLPPWPPSLDLTWQQCFTNCGPWPKARWVGSWALPCLHLAPNCSSHLQHATPRCAILPDCIGHRMGCWDLYR